MRNTIFLLFGVENVSKHFPTLMIHLIVREALWGRPGGWWPPIARIKTQTQRHIPSPTTNHRPRESQSSRYMFPKSVLSRVKFPPFPLFWFHAEDFKVGCSQQVMKPPAKPSYKCENFLGAPDLVSIFAPMFQDLPYLHKSCNLRKKKDPGP